MSKSDIHSLCRVTNVMNSPVVMPANSCPTNSQTLLYQTNENHMPDFNFLDNYVTNPFLFTKLVMEGFTSITEITIPPCKPLLMRLLKRLYAAVINYVYKSKRFMNK